jgi:Uncharacterized protein conserved in bacteria (DUF2188)
MPSSTYHVMPAKKGWVLRKAGATDSKPFTTQREAIEDARKHLTSAPGQIVIHNANGNIRDVEFYKLPRIQSPPRFSRIKARKIDRAITSIVFDPRFYATS